MTEGQEVFADISVLLDYCLVYQDGQRDADFIFQHIDDQNGQITASETAYRALNQMVSNRQRLFKYLMDRATECLRDDDNPEEKFKSEFLSYSALQNETEFTIDESFLPDITALREYLEDVGLKGFREDLSDVQSRGAIQRRKLRQVFITDENMFSKGGESAFMIEIAISNVSDYDVQEKSLVDGAFWSKSKGDVILVSHGSGPYENRSDLLDAISDLTTSTVRIHSPHEIRNEIEA